MRRADFQQYFGYATIKLFDKSNESSGYDFLNDSFLSKDVKNILLKVCKNTDVLFFDENSKNMFLSLLEKRVIKLVDLWCDLYSDFDISTKEGQAEILSYAMEIAEELAIEYGISSEENDQIKFHELLNSEDKYVRFLAYKELRNNN